MCVRESVCVFKNIYLDIILEYIYSKRLSESARHCARALRHNDEGKRVHASTTLVICLRRQTLLK